MLSVMSEQLFIDIIFIKKFKKTFTDDVLITFGYLLKTYILDRYILIYIGKRMNNFDLYSMSIARLHDSFKRDINFNSNYMITHNMGSIITYLNE